MIIFFLIVSDLTTVLHLIIVRLSQARAKACLRPFVLREDAEDVVELMIESVKQVHMDEGGTIDKTRGGAGGKSKKRRAFLEAMRTSGQSEFVYSDLQRFADRVNMPVGGFRGAIRRAKCSLESFYLLFSFNSLAFSAYFSFSC